MPDQNLTPVGSAGPLFEADPCAGRHKGNAESEAAWQRVKPHVTASALEILEMIRRAGTHGLTSAEIGRRLDRPKHYFSGRLTELRAAGLIVDANRRRENCAVLCAAEVMLQRQET